MNIKTPISFTSEGDITFTAKKRITLIGGGSYLILDAGKIEYGTLGWYQRRVKKTFKAKAAEMPLNLPMMPLADGYSEYFVLRDQKTGKPLKDFPYSLSVGGAMHHGTTDDRGHTRRGWSRQSEEIEVTPHPDQFRREWLTACYWDAATTLPLDFSTPEHEDN